MFHFADAPHIIVYEQKEEHPWWYTVGVIIAVLVGVLSAYYTMEAAYRAARKFWLAVLREPQSTVSTPRCMSPVRESQKNSPPDVRPSTPAVISQQKVRMNEPVNCVFIRPVTPPLAADSPKRSVVNKSSPDDDVLIEATPANKTIEKPVVSPHPRLDEVKFDATSNVNCRPTMAPLVEPHTPTRKTSGVDRAESSRSENEHLVEWIERQIVGCQLLETDCSKAGAELLESSRELLEPASDFMGLIQEAIESHFNAVSTDTDTDENISEMSMVTESTVPSLCEVPLSVSPGPESAGSQSNIGKETVGGEEEADIVIDESHLFTENENQCDGSILVSSGAQKVLFRWTDDRPMTVDSVTLTGSFFGWKMNVPMRRSGEKAFEVCVELPEGMHDYSIHVFRFD